MDVLGGASKEEEEKRKKNPCRLGHSVMESSNFTIFSSKLVVLVAIIAYFTPIFAYKCTQRVAAIKGHTFHQHDSRQFTASKSKQIPELKPDPELAFLKTITKAAGGGTNVKEDTSKANASSGIDSDPLVKKEKVKAPKPFKKFNKLSGNDQLSAAADMKRKSGYNYFDDEGEYDVPFTKEPKWYRLNVRKGSENKITEILKNGKMDRASPLRVIQDAYYPVQPQLKFLKKVLDYGYNPMLPALTFVKTPMSPMIADSIEGIYGVKGFMKNKYGYVVPLDEIEAAELEYGQANYKITLTEDQLRFRKGEYVEIVLGASKGEHGIIEGIELGRIVVRIRREGERDILQSFPLNELRYLVDPPNDVNKMTAKDAVESLMSKNPNHPMLRKLKRDGLLEEILYPDGTPESMRSGEQSRYEGGREGGRRVRSIAKPDRISKGSWEPKREKLFTTNPSDSDSNSNSFNSFLDDILDAATSSGNRKDQINFDQYLRDLDAPIHPNDSRRKVTNNNDNNDKSKTPQMEDFSNFEDYLNALVSHKQGKSSDNSGGNTRVTKAGTSQYDDDLDSFFKILEEDEQTSKVGKKSGDNSKDYESMTVKDLKEEARIRGISTSGTKAELVSRLSEP